MSEQSGHVRRVQTRDNLLSFSFHRCWVCITVTENPQSERSCFEYNVGVCNSDVADCFGVKSGSLAMLHFCSAGVIQFCCLVEFPIWLGLEILHPRKLSQSLLLTKLLRQPMLAQALKLSAANSLLTSPPRKHCVRPLVYMSDQLERCSPFRNDSLHRFLFVGSTANYQLPTDDLRITSCPLKPDDLGNLHK